MMQFNSRTVTNRTTSSRHRRRPPWWLAVAAVTLAVLVVHRSGRTVHPTGHSILASLGPRSAYGCRWLRAVRRCRAPASAARRPLATQSQRVQSTDLAAESAPTKSRWTPLFDGKSLDGWQITDFGGQGEVHVQDGSLILEMGGSMTGITYQREFPKFDFELRLEAMRLDGYDFFCGVTFPVNDSYCSFIVGGWGGGVVGLSSLDGMDASENETTQYIQFENEKWYQFRVRVTRTRIQTWIDNELIVDEDISQRQVSTRIEVDLNKPFGFATWETKGALRRIQLRRLDPNETADARSDGD